MPRKDGELTIGEIRELIKAHRQLTTQMAPRGLSRQQLLAWAKKKGYDIDVKKGTIKRRKVYTGNISLEKAKNVDKDEKQKAALKQNKKN